MKFDFSSINTKTIKKSLNYIKSNGIGGVWSRMREKVGGPGNFYNTWYRRFHEPKDAELAHQRQTTFDYMPVISIIVPAYKTDEKYLREMIESVKEQTYSNWELCIVDGSDAQNFIVNEYLEGENRIKYLFVDRNRGISGNSNIAMDMATGDYVTWLDHDDVLPSFALFKIVEALQETRFKMIYTDEDKMSSEGVKYIEPSFKPDFNIDLIRSYNYIKHLFVVEREFAKEVGKLDPEYDGAQDYDFILRCIEKSDSIKHLPYVLYHKRVNNSTVSMDTHDMDYVREAGRRALAAHIARMGYYATVVNSEIPGMYKVMYETPGNPMISIIIPGGTSPELLEKCTFPLYEKARYNTFEIIIIDSESENKNMTAFYHKIEGIRKNVKIITNTKLDGLPAIRNFGASMAMGEYLLFLDNNVEIMDVSAMGEMLSNCMRNEIGAVSGTLYDDNDMIAHQGYVVGGNKLVVSPYKGLKRDDMGYLIHNHVNYDYSAASASCMMVKKSVFYELGGFSSKFKTYLCDVDFCLKLNEINQYVVSLPDARWHYHTVKNTVSNVARMEDLKKSEEDYFKILWASVLKNGDRFYNINFNRNGKPFTLPEVIEEDEERKV